MSSGYLSVGGGNRSGGEGFGLPAQASMPGGGSNIGLGENDHVRWAWGGYDEKPRGLDARMQANKKRSATVKVTTQQTGSGKDASSGGEQGGSSSGVAAASLSLMQHQAMTQSEVKSDLLDVLRMISSGSVSIQTDAPSMTRSQRTVQMESGGASRSIALQCGLNKQQNNAATQVSESEVLGTLLEDTADAVDEMIGSGGNDGGNGDDDDENGNTMMNGTFRGGNASFRLGNTTKDKGAFGGSTVHSRHLPNSDIPADSFPSFLAEAKQLGVCNRYGFISMPKPPFMLPPRRSVKTVDPGQVTHLYAKHNIKLDDATNGRLSRTLQLWTQGSGFVPKF